MKISFHGTEGYIMPSLLLVLMLISLILSALSTSLCAKQKYLEKEASVLYRDLEK